MKDVDIMKTLLPRQPEAAAPQRMKQRTQQVCLISRPNVSHTFKAVGAAAARAAKVAALFRSSLNIHNQFSQVSLLALAWPHVLYVYV